MKENQWLVVLILSKDANPMVLNWMKIAEFMNLSGPTYVFVLGSSFHVSFQM